ncbi:MAG: hypothetical protein GY717_03450 [Rhodobacteraceae bacterium]|nr:hypothetical protein [Paracoccaceae bacterium]
MRFFPILVLLVATLAGGAVAENRSWAPPPLIPDNPVLKHARSWMAIEGKITVAGVHGYDDFVPGGVVFSDSINLGDTENVNHTARPFDGVGLAYRPPFVVVFPTPAGFDDLILRPVKRPVYVMSVRL